MAKGINSLEDLADIELEEEEDAEDLPQISDKSIYRRHSKSIALTIGFLLGITDDAIMMRLENPEEYIPIKETMEKDSDAVAIRHLNNIRSNLMLHFKDVSRNLHNIGIDFIPVYEMEEFKEDFKALNRMSIYISTGRPDINEYIKNINFEISKRIDKMEKYFPDWVRFKHIRNMFMMPKQIPEERKKFQVHKSFYPFQRYFYWKHPFDVGYLLTTDADVLTIAYGNGNEIFTDHDRVSDASDLVKNNVNEFINSATKIQVFIDGENADPYRFASAIDGLNDDEVKKINKIVIYYDSEYTTKAWTMLKHFTFGVEVEAIPVERIREDKSLVDHRLVMGVSRALYRDNVDSIILVSSDSDFWSVIDASEDSIRYLVMVESEKCGHEFKSLLRDKEIFYCYLDNFMTPDDDSFFALVFKSELKKLLKEQLQLGSATKLFTEALTACRANVSTAEEDMLFEKYMKTLSLGVDKEGNFFVEIAD
ncbi:MAG: NYN domain-containing protein [Clostridia bacterium]|nr:NYN domain-containing protein [Clostridia bacterium]